jgi:hypothetical protein
MQHIIGAVLVIAQAVTRISGSSIRPRSECGRSRETGKGSDMAGYAGLRLRRQPDPVLPGLRLHLITTPSGLPIAYAITNAKTDERDTALAMNDLDLVLANPHGQTLMANNRTGLARAVRLLEVAFVLLGIARRSLAG